MSERIIGVTVKLSHKTRKNNTQTEFDDGQSNFSLDSSSIFHRLASQFRSSLEMLTQRYNKVVLFGDNETRNTPNLIPPLNEDDRILALAAYQVSLFVSDIEGKNIFGQKLWGILKITPDLLLPFQKKYATKTIISGCFDNASYREKIGTLYNDDGAYDLNFKARPEDKAFLQKVHGKNIEVSMELSYHPDLLGLITKRILHKLIALPVIKHEQLGLLD